jgi:hypothetical protein
MVYLPYKQVSASPGNACTIEQMSSYLATLTLPVLEAWVMRGLKVGLTFAILILELITNNLLIKERLINEIRYYHGC